MRDPVGIASTRVFCTCLALGFAGSMPVPDKNPDIVVSLGGEVSSLKEAIRKARVLRSVEGSRSGKTVNVLVRPGRYPVMETVRLTPEDSGVRFVGEGPRTSVFCGGVEIGPFVADETGVWSADVPKNLEPEQLWVNDRRAVRARTPNDGQFFYMRECDDDDPSGTFVACPTDLASLAGLPPEELQRVMVVYWQSWDMGYAAVREVDFTTGKVKTARRGGRSYFFWDRTCPRFVLENYRGALDDAGEWFYDPAAGKILYLPRSGERPETSRAFVPTLETILKVEGDAGRGARVRNLCFESIGFEGTCLNIGPDGVDNRQSAANVQAAAVDMAGVEDFVMRDCRVAHTGAHGVWIHGGSVRSKIEHSLIEDLGASGVKFGDPKEELTHRELNSAYLTLVDSIVRHGGCLLNGAVGVWLGQVSDCRVVHNDILDFLYTGVSMGWTWGYAETMTRCNHVDFNHIHHILQGRLSDGGAIYSLGNQDGSTVCNNWIHDVNGYEDNGSPAWGLYTDEGSANILFASNLVERCRSGAIHQHYGRENLFVNNIFATFDNFGVWRSRAENHITIRVMNNIFWWTNPKAGAYICNSKGPVTDIFADGNIYWCAAGRLSRESFNGGSWDAWREGGKDTTGVLADPLFIDPANGDWRFRPDSPVLKTGFRPFDWRRAGVYKTDSSWVSLAAERTWDAFKGGNRAPACIRERARVDFEKLAPGVLASTMGALAPLSDSQGKTGSIEIVAAAVAQGSRALKLIEVPGLEKSFQPMVSLGCRIGDGVARLRFSVRGDKSANVSFETRDYESKSNFVIGTTLRLVDERFTVCGRTVCRVPADTWADVELSLVLSGPQKGEWTCSVTPRGGETKTVRSLRYASLDFACLTWIGFISYGPEGSSWCLDDIRLWKEDVQ